MGERCETCRFSTPQGTPLLTCRRLSPSADPRRDAQRLSGVFEAIWPDVYPNDWCGEYQPKDPRNDG
jgi:hypothetical protein